MFIVEVEIVERENIVEMEKPFCRREEVLEAKLWGRRDPVPEP